jgi:hypothetical protein
VDGKFVKKNFKLTYKNWNRLSKEFKQSAQKFTKKCDSFGFGLVPHWFSLATYKDVMEIDAVSGNATGY